MIVINNKNECCGCSSCASVCPKECIIMRQDEEGFLYPEVNKDQCIECHKCENVCPFLNETDNAPRLDVYAGYILNEEIRINSSSGGIFTAIAENIIEQNGLVYGVTMDANCRSCRYIKVENKSELHYLRGSKYIQCNPVGIYREVKKSLFDGKKVFFSGTPCQVNGLKKYLKKDYDNLFCLDFICHGVPSPMVWEKYVDHIERKKKKKVIGVDFRSKKISWSKFGFNINMKAKQLFISKNSSSFFNFFMRDLCLRPSCYQCQAKKKRMADVTIGDFWGIEDVLPEMNDEKGVSLIIVRSLAGKEMMDNIQNKVKLKKTEYEKAVMDNKAEYRSVSCPNERVQFFKDMNTLPYEKVEIKYLYPTSKQRIKKFLMDVGIWKYVESYRGGVKRKNKLDYGIKIILK